MWVSPAAIVARQVICTKSEGWLQCLNEWSMRSDAPVSYLPFAAEI